MSIAIHLYYTGEAGAARAFAEEMTASGIVEAIRQEPGNLGYAYFFPMEQPDTVLLVDRWESQQALDQHHHSPMMARIMELREKYDLHTRAERFVPAPELPETDAAFLRK